VIILKLAPKTKISPEIKVPHHKECPGNEGGLYIVLEINLKTYPTFFKEEDNCEAFYP